MAELADAADSKSAEGNLMGVRFPLPAPIKSITYMLVHSFRRRGDSFVDSSWEDFVHAVCYFIAERGDHV